MTEDATTLFVDLAGFTPLTERLARLGSRGTEDLSAVLRQFFGSVTDLVLDHGGDPVAYGGDALTIVFDGPQTTTLGAAARAADAIRELAERTAGTSTAAGPVTLQTRIGIARGSVTTAVAHSQRRSVPVHLGAGLDLAVEAESAAQPGQVFLHPTLAASPVRAPVPPTSGGVSLDSALDPPELERLVHPAVLARLGIGAALLESHRSVTVAFVRFTAASTRELPMFLAAVGEMLEVVDAGGGEVVQVSGGDKGVVAMVVFGAPIARDDDPLRAVETMIELRRRQRALATGVATGPVFTALVGSDRRCFAANTGPAVNLAARLMQSASTGQLLVEATTWLGASGHLRAQGPPRPLQVKGVEGPVEVRAVTGWRRSRRRQLATGSSPLVGRSFELRAIERLLDDLSRGHGRAVLLEGEPGLGKTRLVREAADRARTRGITAVLASASDHPRGRTAGLWRDCLRGLSIAPTRAGRRQWVEALTDALPDAPEQIPALGRLLGVPMPASELTRDMPPAIEAELAQTLFGRLIAQAAESRRILLVIENTHELDEGSHSFLAQLARTLDGSQAGMLLTRRHGDDRGADQTPRLDEHLRLGELASPHAALLAADIWGQLGGGTAPTWLAQAVAKRAGGNPLLIRIVTHALKSRWEPGQPPPTHELTDASLGGLLSERVDRLPALPRQLLNLLAVAKRPLTSDLAETTLATELDETTTGETAQQLVAADLVQIDLSGGADKYRLRHDVLQQVVYEQLSHAERVRLHRSLADHLAITNADPVEVAEHVRQLDDRDRARHWFPRAATSARESWSISEAIIWWQRAMPLLSGGDRDAAEVEYLELLLIGGKNPEVLSLITEHEPSPLSGILSARRLHVEGEAAFLCGLFDRSEAAVRRVLDLTDGVDEARHQRGLELLVRVRCERGDTHAATVTARTQLARAQATGDARAIATAHASLGMALLLDNNPEEAARQYEAARAEAAALGDVVLEIHVLSDLAGCCHALGAYTTCVELLARARELADTIGYRRHLAYNLTNEAQLRSTLGDPAAAACAALAVQRSLELGDPGAAANAVHTWITSDPALMASVGIWQRVVGIEVALARRAYAAEAGVELALTEARAGHSRQAVRAARDAVGTVADLDQPRVELRAWLARLLAAAGPRTTRTQHNQKALLDGLSALAAADTLSEVDRAEVAVERWRSTRDEVDREVAGLLLAAFAVEPSAVVRSWFAETGTRMPPLPPSLPPPVGIGRLRTTRHQLAEALTALEAAVLPTTEASA